MVLYKNIYVQTGIFCQVTILNSRFKVFVMALPSYLLKVGYDAPPHPSIRCLIRLSRLLQHRQAPIANL